MDLLLLLVVAIRAEVAARSGTVLVEAGGAKARAAGSPEAAAAASAAADMARRAEARPRDRRTIVVAGTRVDLDILNCQREMNAYILNCQKEMNAWD